MKETWKWIPGYEGRYQVSDQGRVRSYWGNRCAVRKIYVRPDGYAVLNLSAANKVRIHYVHRLVAEAFIGPCPDGKQVCHNNGKRSDNRLANIRYGTSLENHADRFYHGTWTRGEGVAGAKLDPARVVKIRSMQGEVPSPVVAEQFGVCKTTVKNIWNRKVWRHV